MADVWTYLGGSVWYEMNAILNQVGTKTIVSLYSLFNNVTYISMKIYNIVTIFDELLVGTFNGFIFLCCDYQCPVVFTLEK